MKKYNIVNGTSYHKDTSETVIRILEAARNSGTRIRVHYGDISTVRDWNEENDVTGYVGRSTGDIKIPLLIYNRSSFGGGGLLDHCVIKIKLSNGGKILYKHPNYQERVIEVVESDMSEYECNTTINGELYGRHTTKKSAERLKTLLS